MKTLLINIFALFPSFTGSVNYNSEEKHVIYAVAEMPIECAPMTSFPNQCISDGVRLTDETINFYREKKRRT